MRISSYILGVCLLITPVSIFANTEIDGNADYKIQEHNGIVTIGDAPDTVATPHAEVNTDEPAAPDKITEDIDTPLNAAPTQAPVTTSIVEPITMLEPKSQQTQPEKNTAHDPAKIDELPKTGPEETILFLFAMLIAGGILFFRNKQKSHG